MKDKTKSLAAKRAVNRDSGTKIETSIYKIHFVSLSVIDYLCRLY